MKRAFLYVRVSTEEQAMHGLSIEDQTAALESWAQTQGYRVAGLYTDAGISARKPASKRPALQQLLADVRSGKGEMVAFTKLDRWFRSIAEYYKMQDVLERHGVSWKAIREDYETLTAAGRLKVNIMLSVAQDEADRTSERIKAINEMKRKKLEALTGESPVGYKIEKKKFIKDPAMETAVDAFFRRFLATGSISAARQCVLDAHGWRLDYQKAHKMLKNPCYCGVYFGTDGMTPLYISREEFDKIQTLRRRVVRKTEKNRVYLFSGLIACGECGARMGGRVNTKQESYYYNCTAHYLKMNGCSNRANLGEKRIEAFLVETVRDQLERRKVETSALAEAFRERDYKNLYSQPKPADGRGIFLPDEANFRRHTCVYGKKI